MQFAHGHDSNIVVRRVMEAVVQHSQANVLGSHDFNAGLMKPTSQVIK
jgi:hypothetical protein